MAKKRKRVPEVAWRMFHDRARTLAETILSLTPPPCAAGCRRNGLPCLGCSGEASSSSLIRPDDPSDYRKLLNNCIVVISDNAPPPGVFFGDNHWSQLEVVRRTIEMLLYKESSRSNVICADYNKYCRSSCTVELLTCSAWGLLLRRIGDEFMNYLLKYTSILLPFPQKNLFQVTGFPITDFFFKLKHVAKLKSHHSEGGTGSRKKRRVGKLGSMPKKYQSSGAFADNVPLTSSGRVGCTSVSQMTSLSGKKMHQSHLSEEFTSSSGTHALHLEGNKQEDNSDQIFLKDRKRRRPCLRKRCSKRRQLDLEQMNLHIQYAGYGAHCNGSTPELQSGYNPQVSLQCSCCSMFQIIKCDFGAQIERQSIFSKMEGSSSVFPRKHMLNCLKPNSPGAVALFMAIFGLSDPTNCAALKTCSHTSKCCFSKYPCLYHSSVKLLKSLIHRAQCCQHLSFLEKHCPISSSEISGKSYCQQHQVVAFIWAVCRSILPSDLLGNSSNWRVLRRNISGFVRLRRFEKFSLKQCMHKLKTSAFSFLSNKRSSCYQTSDALKDSQVPTADMTRIYSQGDNFRDTIQNIIVPKLIFWLFSHVVVPVVEANFYVTESDHGKHEVFYYRKDAWKKVVNSSVRDFNDLNYSPLDDDSVRDILRKRSFGFSKVRFCPKENGVRALANLKAPSRMPVKPCSLKQQQCCQLGKAPLRSKYVKYDCFESVNFVLRELHVVLKGLQRMDPKKLGSSVFDYNDIYRNFSHFLSVLKNGSTAMPSVFIVVCDVSKAFDSVKQDKLLSIMEGVMQYDKYVIEKTDQVVCTKNSLWVKQKLNLASRNLSVGTSKFAPFRFNHSLQGILVNKGWSKTVTRKGLFSTLKEHVKQNVLQLDRKYYLQEIGIPQGSILSSLLCSFYYGHMEMNELLPFLESTSRPVTDDLSETPLKVCRYSDTTKSSKDAVILESSPQNMLCRFIDDFLFMSTSKNEATSFFSRLQAGFPDYNCGMNADKFGVNFRTDHAPENIFKKVYEGDDGVPFLPWSGLLINCCTLEIQADYSRYQSTHLSSTLTVSWQDKPGRQLKAKLCHYLRPKCHHIFYDSSINSPSVVRLNIYQAFLICAMKFHCYVRDLSPFCKLGKDSYKEAVDKSLQYMQKLINKRMHTVDPDAAHRPKFEVEKGEIQWLGLMGYIRVLKKKQSRHKDLLSFLRCKLVKLEQTICISPVLRYAVDDSHSSALWKIKY